MVTPVVLAERVALLQTCQLFDSITPPDLERIASLASGVPYPKDQPIYTQGHPCSSLILLRTGTVKITQLSAQGSEVILWMHGPGSPLGMICEEPCAHNTCIPMEKCTALLWNPSTLTTLRLQFPLIQRNASRLIASRLQELEERFREISTERVSKRLAATLLRLSKAVGKKNGKGIQIEMNREDLAQMIGTTLFTVSRIICQWCSTGIVFAGREFVTITSPSLLELEACDRVVPGELVSD